MRARARVENRHRHRRRRRYRRRDLPPLRAEGARVAVFDMTWRRPRRSPRHPRRTAAGPGVHCDITDRASVDAAVRRTGSARADRRARQQRRLGCLQAVHEDRAGAVGKADRDQPDRRAAHAPCGAAGMVARKEGRIVNIASDAARVGSSGEAVYAACKGGLVAFSKTLAREHARHGITVNVVCPGPTDTALFADYKEGAGNPEKLMEAFTRSIPLGRIGQPDDLPAPSFLRQRRRRLRHRPGAERLRRPDHERLTPAPTDARRHHGIRRHPLRVAQRRGLDHDQPARTR